jgi:hypothetical protein
MTDDPGREFALKLQKNLCPLSGRSTLPDFPAWGAHIFAVPRLPFGKYEHISGKAGFPRCDGVWGRNSPTVSLRELPMGRPGLLACEKKGSHCNNQGGRRCLHDI